MNKYRAIDPKGKVYDFDNLSEFIKNANKFSRKKIFSFTGLRSMLYRENSPNKRGKWVEGVLHYNGWRFKKFYRKGEGLSE